MKNINYLESENYSMKINSPGLVDPGVIILTNKGIGQFDVPGGDQFIELPEEILNWEHPEIIDPEGAETVIQYKADTNKFLGYIGDLAEYKFKHIPEKFYYNNIPILEFLCSEDQRYIGSELAILKAISENSIFTELTENDYKNSDSLPSSKYNKFKPRYFGTATVGERTVVLFMVPPGYNTVFISNGSNVYSKEDYFNSYGVQLENPWFTEAYMEAAPGLFARPGGGSPHNGGVADSIGNFVIGSPERIREDSLHIIEEYVDTVIINSETDPDPEPNDGGRGNHGRGTHSVMSNLGEDFTLVRDLDRGLTVVMEADINPNMESYDYEFPGQSSYEFKELNTYNFLFKRKPVRNSDHYRYFSFENFIGNDNNLKNFILNWFDPYEESNNGIEAFLIEEDSTYVTYGMYVYVYLSEAYKNIRGITKYTLTKDGGSYKIYRKVKNYPEKNDSLLDIQMVKFKWKKLLNPSTDPKEVIIVTSPTKGPEKYGLVPEETSESASSLSIGSTFKIGEDVVRITNNKTLEVVSGTSNIEHSIGDLIKIGTNIYRITTNWYIKVYKTSAAPRQPDQRANFNIDTSTVDYHPKPVWDDLFGKANYYEYLNNTCQVEISLSEDNLGYYKLVKLVISPVELHNYSLESIGPSAEYKIELKVGDRFKVRDDILQLEEDYSLTKVNDNIDTVSISLTEGQLIQIKQEDDSYLFFSLKSEINIEGIESVNIVNLGYNTSDNPLKNLDKYLVRGDEEFIKKYSINESNVVDLTSGTYVSSGLRESDNEFLVNFFKYSYRKTYRKGQTAIVGLESYDLKDNIIDIQYIVPSIYTDSINTDGSSIKESLWGSIVYDYSSGLVYKIGRDGQIETNYTASSLTSYLYRYYGEYYLVETDNRRNKELQRIGKLGIRTWISLCDNNRGCLPGMSKNWMSRDGNLTVGDKVWIMLVSGTIQKKIIGEVVKHSDTNTNTVGIGIRLVCEELKNVRLNGVEVLVDNYDGQLIEYNGMRQYVYDLYMLRQIRTGGIRESDIVADITNNIVFRDKINYLVNSYEN
jgi:hypothetical protein